MAGDEKDPAGPPADPTVILDGDKDEAAEATSAHGDAPPAAAVEAELTVVSGLVSGMPQAAVAATAEAKHVEPGTLINNNYRITALIVAGGMGEVYRAENVFTGDPVAVKVIKPGLENDPSVLDLFRREARVLVQLRDDAIVRYHNFVLDPGLQRFCLIMEFVEGRHLGTRIKDSAPPGDAEALTLMRRLARGLARGHASGVTHRDLSPDNVILRDDRIDEPVLIDFGIARSTELGDGLAGRFAGKFKYIAPEQLGHWGGETGPRSDVYGLALLIAAVVRGAPLPMGDSVVSASAARLAIPDLSGLSHRLFPLLQHMLEPDPDRRPPDMTAVLRILDDPICLPAQYRLPLWPGQGDAAGGGDAVASPGIDLSGLSSAGDGSLSPFAADGPPPPVAEAAPPQRRPNRVVPVAILGATALIAAIGVGIWSGWPKPSDDTPAPPVAPLSMAPRDAATREGFLADQPMPQCAFASRLTAGPNAGTIRVLWQTPFDTAPVQDAYQAAFNSRPAVIPEQVAAPQCPVVKFLRDIAGRAPVPALTANLAGQGGSFEIRGEVEAGRAQTGDVERNLWLFLVSPAGEIYDLTLQLQSGQASMSRFAVSVARGEDGTPGPFLLVAVASDQPLPSVSAAPAGAQAAELLPHVLAELAAHSDAPAANLAVLDPSAAP